MSMLPANLTALAQSCASAMGRAFRQEYRKIDGIWFLFTMGKQVRAMSDDEIAWHVARNHAPFVPGGINSDHPDWWKEPAANTTEKEAT